MTPFLAPSLSMLIVQNFVKSHAPHAHVQVQMAKTYGKKRQLHAMPWPDVMAMDKPYVSDDFHWAHHDVSFDFLGTNPCRNRSFSLIANQNNSRCFSVLVPRKLPTGRKTPRILRNIAKAVPHFNECDAITRIRDCQAREIEASRLNRYRMRTVPPYRSQSRQKSRKVDSSACWQPACRLR